MSSRRFCCLLLLILIAGLSLAQQRQEPDQVRDAFLVTRDATLVSQDATLAKPKKSKDAALVSQRATTQKSNSHSPSSSLRALGLGYTVFKKGADGKPVRVNPEQVFRAGDGVRFMIESNETGYLYIFTSENDGPPKLIFPDPSLNGGTNRIKAHVPCEVPSKDEPGDWWFFFNDKEATERFYLVVTRQPLATVKTGRTLVAAYQKNPAAHPWQPTQAVWKGLLAQAGEFRVSKGGEFGVKQTEAEHLAVVRGVELRPGTPAPSVVKISTSPKSGVIVAQIVLSHK